MHEKSQQSPERQAALQQHFHGSIEPITIGYGSDMLIVSMLQAELTVGDKIIISGKESDNPALLQIGGQHALAELKLGGGAETDPKGFPSHDMYILKVDEQTPSDLKRIAQLAANYEGEAGKEGFLLAVKDPLTGSVDGFAFAGKGVRMGFIGRNSNLKWIDYTGKSYHKDTTPFRFNNSVSREQMVVSYNNDGNLSIKILSENSRTLIKTRASQEHKAVIERNKQLEDNQDVQADRGRKASKGILGLLKKGR